MLTEDITIAQDGSWTEIALTTTQTIIYNGSGVDMMVRFGALSTSDGFRFQCKESMSVDEAIWIRPSPQALTRSGPFKVTVTR